MSADTPRPDVQTLLNQVNAQARPRLADATPAEARAMAQATITQLEKPIGPLAVIRDLEMPGAEGHIIKLRLFDSRTDRDAGPVVVFYHGGGFVVGDLDTHAALCAEIARLIDLPVIAVDYALAPERPWPAGPDDAEMAARWIADLPEVTGLVLAGDSAGGALTIITALALRDQPAAVPVLAQWPIYPAISWSTRFASFDAYGEGYLLDRSTLAWFFAHYQADIRHWRATPTRISQAGLPPTLVLTAALDPLVDQGRAYADQCRTDGVPTLYREAEGTIHGFLTLRAVLPSGEEELRACIALLKTMIPAKERAS